MRVTLRSVGVAIEGPHETHWYNITVMYGGFQGDLDWGPIITRRASLSASDDDRNYGR